MDVPVISIKGRKSHFAISCGIGFDAAVCHEVGVTPMKKVLNRVGLGKLVYLFVALKQLLFAVYLDTLRSSKRLKIKRKG